MVMNKRDLYRAFSPGKNVRRTIGRRKSLNRRSIEKPFNANIKVVVRVRPVINNETDHNVRSIVKVLDDRMLVFDPKEDEDDFYFQGIRQRCRDMTKKSNKEMKFAFDKVFDTEATNEQVFSGSTKEIIGYLLDGYNCSVFVYGATGAGKTYTMLGTRESPGITYLTMVELYQQMDLLKDERKFEVAVSYMEVYNETVKDLISPSPDQLHVREDATYGVKVQGLSVQRPTDAAHLLSLLESGNRNRSQHPTDANAESSRSHAVFQVYIKMTSNCLEQGDNGEGSVIKVVKLSMIDLAGSERGSATGFKGSRFAEGANINKSLLSLGNCINALADGLKHIPYRNSKLTRLLKDSLGGNCKTVMIANVSPAVISYEDTYNTLKYADRAKKIKLRTKKNVVAVDMHVTELANLVEELRRENAELKRRLAELEAAGGGGDGGGEGMPPESTFVKSEDVSSTLPCTVVNEKDLDAKEEELNKDASSALNSTFVASPSTKTVVESKENDPSFEKAFMERVSQVYSEREMLQKKLFQLETENRILSWKATNKRRGLHRLQSLCGSSSKKYEKCEAKSLSGEEKTAMRLNRIEERKKLSWNQLCENGRKATQLYKEAKSITLPKLEEKSQELKIKGWKCMADHAIRMGILAERERSQTETILEKVSSTLQEYHTLLSGHGLVTQALEKQYDNLVQLVEGIKGVSWQDQLPVQEQETEGSEKAELENKGKLNETFCLNDEDGDKDYVFNQLVLLPVDKIVGHGLCETDEEKVCVSDGEVAAVSDGMAKVQLFSSLAPTSILSSVLPFAPLTYQFAAPTSTLQKNSTTIPRSFAQPKSWKGSSYPMSQRSFSREKSREDKENSSSSEKMLQPSGNKSSLTGTPPISESSGGSVRKMMHPKQRTLYGKSHPYLYPGRNRAPLEPRLPMTSNYLAFSVPKSQPSSARKNLIQPSSMISSKIGQLSSFGK